MQPNVQPSSNNPATSTTPAVNVATSPAVNPGQAAQPAQPANPANPTNPTNPTSPATAPPKNPNSTQNSLVFEELRDNMVIMADGTFRGVVAAQSINFDLMSGRERDGIEVSYQDFLNSLNFPIQIYIRSQKVDIGPYLEKLENLRRNEDNMLLGVLMDDYIQFIDALSQEANIMDKSFFVAVPYSIGDSKQKVGDSSSNKFPITQLFSTKSKHLKIKVPADQYDRAKEEITNRINAVIDGLSQTGIRAVRLKTKELGELYYNVYNPDTAVKQPIGDFRNYTNTLVRGGTGPNPNANPINQPGEAV
jgi:hypothetical protein